MPRMLARWLSMAVIIAAVGLSACGSDDKQGSGSASAADGKTLEGETIKIGAIFPLTGPFAASGKGNRDGAKAAVEYLNGGGSESGARYELVERDDQGNLTQTVAVARELGGQVTALVAGTTGGSAAAIAPLLPKSRVPLVGAALTGIDGQARKYPWAFGVGETSVQRQTPSAEYAKQAAAGGPIAEIHTTDAYGAAYYKSLAEVLKGENVVAKGVPPTATDMTAQLRDLQNSGAQVLIINAFGEPFIKIAQNLAQLGWRPKVTTLLGALSPGIVTVLKRQAPEVLDGMLAGPLPTPLLTTDSGGEPSTEMGREWAKSMKSVTGRSTLSGDDIVGTYGFDAVLAIDRGLAKAGSTDGEKLRAAIESTPFDGSRGRIQFTADNHSGQQDEDLALARAKFPCSQGACVAAK
jgi:branched-chain amino acid transport system substrate-binding protein